MTDLFDFQAMPRFETERLVLRQMDPIGDLDALFSLFADPDVARFTDTGPFETLEEAEEVMAWIGDIYDRKQGIRWAIAFEGVPDNLIGTGGFNIWNRDNSSAEIGYDLAQQHWGRGLMAEALRPMLGFGFRQMGLNRIEADVTVGNDASARVLEKLGFREEGLLRQRGFWKGEYHDLRFFGLLRDEWTG